MKLGVISDTHDRFHPALVRFLNECDEVLHAGDVTTGELLAELRAFSALSAVRGNNDVIPGLPWTVTKHVGAATLLAVHILGTSERPEPLAADAIAQERPNIVIHGHTHRPSLEVVAGRLYLNPGSAGRGRSGRPCTFARLTLRGDRGSVRFFEGEGEMPRPFSGEIAFSLKEEAKTLSHFNGL